MATVLGFRNTRICISCYFMCVTNYFHVVLCPSSHHATAQHIQLIGWLTLLWFSCQPFITAIAHIARQSLDDGAFQLITAPWAWKHVRSAGDSNELQSIGNSFVACLNKRQQYITTNDNYTQLLLAWKLVINDPIRPFTGNRVAFSKVLNFKHFRATVTILAK